MRKFSLATLSTVLALAGLTGACGKPQEPPPTAGKAAPAVPQAQLQLFARLPADVPGQAIMTGSTDAMATYSAAGAGRYYFRVTSQGGAGRTHSYRLFVRVF